MFQLLRERETMLTRERWRIHISDSDTRVPLFTKDEINPIRLNSKTHLHGETIQLNRAAQPET